MHGRQHSLSDDCMSSLLIFIMDSSQKFFSFIFLRPLGVGGGGGPSLPGVGDGVPGAYLLYGLSEILWVSDPFFMPGWRNRKRA